MSASKRRTRPAAQGVASLDDLAASVAARRELSRASDVRLDSLALSHDADGELLLTSPDGAAEGDRR